MGDAVFAFDVGEGFGGGVLFALAGVDEDGAAHVGGPDPVFNIFVAVDDEPGPRLADGNGLQFFESRRPAGGLFARFLFHWFRASRPSISRSIGQTKFAVENSFLALLVVAHGHPLPAALLA